jgi:hypothetical protein
MHHKNEKLFNTAGWKKNLQSDLIKGNSLNEFFLIVPKIFEIEMFYIKIFIVISRRTK